MDSQAFTAAVTRLFREVAAMTLATCADGTPWATDVYFAPMDWELVFFSSPASRHCRNLAANPACAAAAHAPAAAWRDIRGVQMEGEAAPVEGALVTSRALLAYFEKFPFARALLEHSGATAGRLVSARAHRFRPHAIRYLDNSLGLGTRFTVRFADGRPQGPPEASRQD
jgi:uncharacterized protein YhbP (UPF0306 family)